MEFRFGCGARVRGFRSGAPVLSLESEANARERGPRAGKTFGTRARYPRRPSMSTKIFAAGPHRRRVGPASSSLARALVAHSPPPELVKSPRQKVSFER